MVQKPRTLETSISPVVAYDLVEFLPRKKALLFLIRTPFYTAFAYQKSPEELWLWHFRQFQNAYLANRRQRSPPRATLGRMKGTFVSAPLTAGQKAARTRKRRAAARKARKKAKTEVIAHLPVFVDLTKRNSAGDLRFTVKSGGATIGTLIMGRGSVQWWMVNAKKPTGRWSWLRFANLLNRK